MYFVRVPQSALEPTAKSSQLPLQLSQPESLIKTRCFHLGQLWKKSLPETGLSLPNPPAAQFAMCGKADTLAVPKEPFSHFKPKRATEPGFWRIAQRCESVTTFTCALYWANIRTNPGLLPELSVCQLMPDSI